MLNKKYSLAGKIAVGLSFIGLVLMGTAFFSNSWLVSDKRINGIYKRLTFLFFSYYISRCHVYSFVIQVQN